MLELYQTLNSKNLKLLKEINSSFIFSNQATYLVFQEIKIIEITNVSQNLCSMYKHELYNVRNYLES